MKKICVMVAGSERELLDIEIHPGQTAQEILTQLGLPGYVLSLGPDSNRFFGADENVYTSVVDGDKVYATTKAVVGV